MSGGKAHATHLDGCHFDREGQESDTVTSERKKQWRDKHQRAFRNRQLQRGPLFVRSDTESSEDEIDRVYVARMRRERAYGWRKRHYHLNLVAGEEVGETSIVHPVVLVEKVEESSLPYEDEHKAMVENKDVDEHKVVVEDMVEVEHKVVVEQNVVVEQDVQLDLAVHDVGQEMVPDSEDGLTDSQLLDQAL